MKRRLRMGVIGLNMGRGHVKGFQSHPDADVVAICDINRQRLEAVGNEFGVPNRFTDAEKMIREMDLDGVSVATPNRFHAPLTIAAFRGGCHVLCEKPMAVDTRAAEGMLAAAASARKNLMVNFSYRFLPVCHALKTQVDAGVVGDIYFGRTVWLRRRGIPGMGSSFTDRKLSGGGPLIDLGVHRIDLALWLMGFPEPVAVTGATYNAIARQIAAREDKTYTVEDLACGMVRFANGASLLVEASWASNIGEAESMETMLLGTRGGLVHRNTGGTYNFYAEVHTEENGCLFTKRLDQVVSPVPSAYHEFINSIIEKRKPCASGEEGIKTTKILDGIYRSARTGREIRFPKS